MQFNLLTQALEQKKALAFVYDGLPRVVEVHTVGLTKKGDQAFRGYQVGGESSSGKTGWKLFTAAKCEEPHLTEVTSAAPRDGYRKGDPVFDHIYMEI